jgi:hypothetical protein
MSEFARTYSIATLMQNFEKIKKVPNKQEKNPLSMVSGHKFKCMHMHMYTIAHISTYF